MNASRIRQRTDPPPFSNPYFQTVFLVPQPPPAWPPSFAIVTAHNPDGRAAPEATNRENELALVEHLRTLGVESFEVVGCSPDLTHRENGRAFVATSVAVASEVSRRFRQEAFYWVENGIVFVLSDASGSGWMMARWDERLVKKSV
jgi:hypothetical protein